MAKLTIDVGELKRKAPNIGETRELARLSGMPIGAFQTMDLNSMSLDMMVATILVIQKRVNPAFTLAELDALDWSDIEWVDTTEEPDPTPAPPIKKLRSGATTS